MSTFWTAAVHLFLLAMPAHILAYYPFHGRIRGSRVKILVLIVIIQVIEALLYGLQIARGGSGRETEFGFALVYMCVYFFCVKDDYFKLLFLYLFVMDYVIILRGFCAFLEARFFYSPDMVFYSFRSTLIYTAALAVTVPFMLYFFFHARKQVFDMDAPTFWRVAWMAPALTTGIVLIFTGDFTLEQVYSFKFLLARTLLLLCVFVVYFLLLKSLDSIRRQAVLAEQAAVQEHLLHLQKTQQAQFLRHMDEIRTARHDLRQHLSVIRSCLEKEDTDALKTYLDAYEQKLPADIHRVFCQNFAVNCILAYYAEEARKYKIDYRINCDFPEQLPVSEPELCALLGNLLENAVEACKDVDPAVSFICVNSLCGQEHIVLTVDNSCSREPVMENGRFFSARHEGYGTGTYSIKDTAERNGGTAEFSFKNGVFYASVLLYG